VLSTIATRPSLCSLRRRTFGADMCDLGSTWAQRYAPLGR
jgi:hypothetical protein